MKTNKTNTQPLSPFLNAFNPRRWKSGLVGLTLACTASTGFGSDDDMLNNRLKIAETQANFHQSIWNYNGIDPSIRAMQAILWMGGFEGDEDGPVEEGDEGGGDSGGDGGGDSGGDSGGQDGGGGGGEQQVRSDSYIELTLITVAPDGAEHRVILPLQEMGDGREGFLDRQSAFLEVRGRHSACYERLVVVDVTSTPEGLTDGIVVVPPTDDPAFAIVIGCSEDGAVDWETVPAMVCLKEQNSGEEAGDESEVTPLIHQYTSTFKGGVGPWVLLPASK